MLYVQHLPDLTRFDADSLAQLSYISTLYIQSWPSIEKFKFRLGSVVSGLASLKKLSARILEYNGVLYDQVSRKLSEICNKLLQKSLSFVFRFWEPSGPNFASWKSRDL